MSDEHDHGDPKGFTRREVLAGAAATALLAAGGTSRASGQPPPVKHWGFLLDLTRCIGCGSCVRGCRDENAVPDGFFRTWVERYTFARDGSVTVDSPDGALNGFQSDPPVDPANVAKSFFVPKVCNHCEDSPCVQVCPVGASYRTADGVVLVDRKHCVGCGYCVQACPYGCRYISPKGYADKCTLCYHRTSKGLPPACVQACPAGARMAGDIGDANSPISKALAAGRHGVLKPELGTHPNAFYLGLDQEVI